MPEQKRTARGVLGGLLGFVGLSAAAGVLATAAVTPALAMTGMTANSAIGVFDEMPEYLEISPLMEKSNIYAKDADGKNVLLASFYEQNRVEVQWDEISQYLKDAAVATEDNRFYDHGGIDLTGTLRAVVSNSLGEDTQGGSSITQQYVKNVLVQECERKSTTDEDLQKCYTEAAGASGVNGYARKLKEMRYAVGLEKKYSKDEILRGYLNISGFGGVIYGVETAANYYFGTSAKDVTLSQAATIIGMANNPNLLRIDHPDNKDNGEANGYELTKKRRDVVLKAMLHYGKITQEQYDEATAAKIEPKITKSTNGCAAAVSNAYFCDYVTKVIRNDPAFSEIDLKRGGLDIYTSLDLTLQKTEGDALHAAVPSHVDGMNLGGTATTIEPGTGRILAMVQNTAYSNADKPGHTAVNYNTDYDYGRSGGFQTGSTWKVFTLVEWLLQGHSINETVNGIRRDFNMTDSCTGLGQGTWKREDLKNSGDGGGGPGGRYTVAHGTVRSTNTVFAAMAEQLDLCDIAKTAEAMGAHRADGDDLQTNFSSILGTNETAPLSMANAYATLAAKGMHCDPRAIDKIVKANGEEMKVPGNDCNQAIPENIAATAIEALKGVMQSGGTGVNGNPWAGPIFGKTGTTNDYKDTWLVTSTTEATTAVWVGNIKTENYAPLWHTYINGQLGSQIKFGLTRTIMGKAIELYGANEFPAADSNLTRRVLKDVPDVAGMSVEEATAALRNAGFGSSVSDKQVPSTIEAGRVARTDPGAGARANSGSSITIFVSSGKSAKVPDVTDKSYDDAKTELSDAGFTSVNKADSCEPGGSEPSVAKQDPSGGSDANIDSPVTLTLYCGDNRDNNNKGKDR